MIIIMIKMNHHVKLTLTCPDRPWSCPARAFEQNDLWPRYLTQISRSKFISFESCCHTDPTERANSRFVHTGCVAVRCRATSRGTAPQRTRCERTFRLSSTFFQKTVRWFDLPLSNALPGPLKSSIAVIGSCLLVYHLPAVGEDGEHFIEVFVPVLALADELTEGRESYLAALNSHLLAFCVAEQNPVTDQLDAERTLGLRRRYELCNCTKLVTIPAPFRSV